MWTKRIATLLIVLLMPALALASSATQKVFASGGAVFSEAPSSSNFNGTRPVGLVGVRLPHTNLFTLQGALGYGDLVSLEGALQFHPLGRISGVKPYAFAGFGRYLSGNDQRERSVVPIGVGAEVPLARGIDLNLEVGGRWALATNEPPRSLDLFSGVAPTVGVSYDFSRLSLPRLGGGDDGRPPIADAGTDGAGAEGEDATGQEGNAGEGAPTATDEGPPSTRGRANPGAASDGQRGEGRSNPGAAQGAPQAEGVENPGAAEGATRGAGRSVPGPAREAPSMEGQATMRTGGPARIDTIDGGEMKELPAGTFVMGLTDEDPLSLQQAGRKRVSVTPFALDKYEVSNQEYRQYLEQLSGDNHQAALPDSTIWEEARSRSTWNTYFRSEEFNDYPVVGVTHGQAQAFCEFYDKRLPTEAEWEYAARGDLVGSIYPWPGYEPRNQQGRYLANYNPDRGGYSADGYAFTAPGNAYPPSSWGLYNLSGNVAEWVQDAYYSSYSEISDFNPVYEDPDEEERVVRGGSWASNAFYIGVGVRDQQNRGEASPYIGFRCADELQDGTN